MLVRGAARGAALWGHFRSAAFPTTPTLSAWPGPSSGPLLVAPRPAAACCRASGGPALDRAGPALPRLRPLLSPAAGWALSLVQLRPFRYTFGAAASLVCRLASWPGGVAAGGGGACGRRCARALEASWPSPPARACSASLALLSGTRPRAPLRFPLRLFVPDGPPVALVVCGCAACPAPLVRARVRVCVCLSCGVRARCAVVAWLVCPPPGGLAWPPCCSCLLVGSLGLGAVALGVGSPGPPPPL